MYKIVIVRSCLGHFYWKLLSGTRSIAESNMLSSKNRCFHVIRPIAVKLNAEIEFIDLEKDYEL